MRVGGGITITFTIFDENVSLFFFNLNFTYRPNIFVKRLEKQFTKKKSPYGKKNQIHVSQY